MKTLASVIKHALAVGAALAVASGAAAAQASRPQAPAWTDVANK